MIGSCKAASIYDRDILDIDQRIFHRSSEELAFSYGTIQGQMLYWDATVGKWTVTDVNLLWDAVNDVLDANSVQSTDVNADNISDGTATISGGIGTFAQIIDNGLTANLGIYTDGSKQLTSTPPSSGVLGYWSRAGTIISTATAGDDITITGLGKFKELSITDADWPYTLKKNTDIVSEELVLFSSGAGSDAIFGLMPADGDGTDSVFFNIYAMGTPNDSTDFERLQIGYVTGVYYIRSQFSSSGGGEALLPIKLIADGGSTQFVLNIDGTINTGGDLTVGNDLDVGGFLEVTDDINALTDIIVTGNIEIGAPSTHAHVLNINNGEILVIGTTPALNSGAAAPDVVTITGGKGASHNDLANGKKGSDFVYTSGAGGDDQTAAVTGGDSGDIRFIIGTPGTGNTAGSFGNIFLAENGGNVIVGGTAPDSLFEVDGPVGLAIQTVTGNTTLDNTHSTLLVNASGNVVIALPTAASAYNNTDDIGRVYLVKKIDADADTVTLDGNGAELIDGAATAVITVQWESIEFQSNGTSWYIL